MGAVPIELAAFLAEEIFVHPAPGARRNAGADGILRHFAESAAAAHAARLRGREIEFGADEFELLVLGDGGRHPDGPDFALGDGPAVEQEAVGGDDDRAEPAGFRDEAAVGDVLNPERLAARGAQPAGEAAKAGVAENARRRGLGLAARSPKAGCLPGEAGGGGDQALAVAEPLRFGERGGFFEKQAHPFIPLAGAEPSEQFPEFIGKGARDPAHAELSPAAVAGATGQRSKNAAGLLPTEFSRRSAMMGIFLADSHPIEQEHWRDAMNPRSFRTRLIFLVILMLVPTAVLVLTANLERQKAEKRRIREQALCAAKLAGASQAYYLKQTHRLLATMTEFPFLVLSTNQAHSRKGMENLRQIEPEYQDFGLISSDGAIFCHTLGTNITAGMLPPDFARRVLAQPGFAMSRFHAGAAADQPTLHFAHPVFGADRELARVMYASIKLPLLSAALADVPLPEGGVVTVMDGNGSILARHPASGPAIGQRAESFGLVREALAKGTNLFKTAEPQEERLFALTTVAHDGKPMMFVQVAVPQALMFARANAEFGASFIGLLLISAVLLGLAWWFSERAFLRPVNAMMTATARLTDGDFSARTGISKSRSELHILAHRFDLMAETLRRRQEQLTSANAEITRSNAELEHRVHERTRELETLNRELEAFSYSVSHDLRAPLRHMDGFAQILASDPSMESNAAARRYLGLITKSAQRMGTLIDDLLRFSRMAQQPLVFQTVDTREIVEGIVRELRAANPDRDIVWEICELPPVKGDPSLLRQAWENLISNAVKYSRGRKPAVIAISGAANEGEAVFTVADNGAGFDMAYAKKLFGVFQRLHRDEDFEGTGIGLANVQRIVHRHGGRTWAEGELNKGAKFSFSIPMNPQ